MAGIRMVEEAMEKPTDKIMADISDLVDILAPGERERVTPGEKARFLERAINKERGDDE